MFQAYKLRVKDSTPLENRQVRKRSLYEFHSCRCNHCVFLSLGSGYSREVCCGIDECLFYSIGETNGAEPSRRLLLGSVVYMPTYLQFCFLFYLLPALSVSVSVSVSLFSYFSFGFSRQGFSVQPWLSWNSLCRPGWPRIQKSSCLCLPSARIKGVCHHCPARLQVFKKLWGVICRADSSCYLWVCSLWVRSQCRMTVGWVLACP